MAESSGACKRLYYNRAFKRQRPTTETTAWRLRFHFQWCGILIPMKAEFLRLALCGFLLALPSRVDATESAVGTEISVLSYNIRGLFPLAARDDPDRRMPAIGSLANRYDVAMFQEDFEYHDVIRGQMPGAVGFRGNGMGWDPRRVLAKLLVSPVSIFLPRFSPPYGAGISIFVLESLAMADDFDREAYGICHGWFGSNGDCWAYKGYQRVGIRTPEGAEVDFYNTHLDSGSGRRAVETRARQLEVLARAIHARTKSRAVIVGGDFNSVFNQASDREAIARFRSSLGLRDSGAGPEFRNWRERDYIFYRDGVNTNLEVERAGEAGEFLEEDRALSDHPAVYARFRVTPLASADEGGL